MEFKKIEEKWQKKWEEASLFKADDASEKKCYVLEMFPYPSASGLHMGHALNYTIGDIFARFKRMTGWSVLYPMGFDASGLPAENAAIKAGAHPKEFTRSAVKNYIRQMKELGLSYDWDRSLVTSMPDYYKWNQFFFLKFLEKGLVYKKKASVNWCPECNTVLANEQVHNGMCWRHENTEVEIKLLEQWFIKTTDYAEELLDNIDGLNWPDRIKSMQKNWIGKSHGTTIDFEIESEKGNKTWPIFTTRPDTIYGVTFMVVSAQHIRLDELTTPSQKKAVANFLKNLKSVSEKDFDAADKEGVFTGSYAINPVNNERVPIYAGNFVVADYATGMVMAVPAHDQRDFEFAKKYNIPMKQVIAASFGERKEGAEFRKTISAIIQRKSDSKFLILKWKKQDWISQPIGGIEDEEDLAEAAQREVLEETGYKTKFVKKLGFEFDSHFYADHKKVFRHRRDQPVLLELVDETPEEVNEKEFEQHEAVWMSYKELMKEITHEYNKTSFETFKNGEKAYTGDGVLINSAKFDGANNRDAINSITSFLEKNNKGKKTVQFKLRDWLVSRQRYWGTPIPIVYCDSCGTVPVSENDLPVKLPDEVVFGKGNPLKTNKEFLHTTCPKCNGEARRETDTMDTFFDSSWYFLRYTDNKNSDAPFDKKKAESWMPVTQYIGGAEHACMHLIYARFFTKALRDLGFIDIDEPFTTLFNQGMLQGLDGEKMSKSRGNVILPDDVSKKYGIDTARLFLVSVANPDKDIAWSEEGITGSLKFINRLSSYVETVTFGKTSSMVKSKLQRVIRDITSDIKQFKYNFAVIKLRTVFSSFEDKIEKSDLEDFIKLFSPFCPHIAEEIWEKLGNKDFVSVSPWPSYDESLIDEVAEAAQELAENVRGDILTVLKLAKLEKANKITIIISQPWKYDLFRKLKELLLSTRNPGEIIKEVMSTDLKHYGKDITKIIPGIVKDPSKLPEQILDQKKALSAITKVKKDLEKEFGAKIEVIIAQDSSHPKARQASPNKPAIVIE